MPPRRRKKADDGVDLFAGKRFTDIRKASVDSSDSDSDSDEDHAPKINPMIDNNRKMVAGTGKSKHVYSPKASVDSSDSDSDSDEDHAPKINPMIDNNRKMVTGTGKQPRASASSRLQRKRQRSLSPDSDDDSDVGTAGFQVSAPAVRCRQNSISEKLEQLKATIGDMTGDDGEEDDDTTEISFVGPELPDSWTVKVHYPARSEPYEFDVTPASAVWDMMDKIANDIGADPKYVLISWKGKPLEKWVELGRVGLLADDELHAQIMDAGSSLQAAAAVVAPAKASKPSVKITVNDGGGGREKPKVYIIEMDRALATLRAQYAEDKGLRPSQVIVTFDGDVVQDRSTPASFDLDAGEEVQFEARLVPG